MSKKKAPEPLKLTPIEELKKVVAALAQVPKGEIDKGKGERPKPP